MFLLQKLSSSLRLADVRIALYDIGEEFAVAIYHAMHVVYLFTKTDIMTTLIPNTAFGIVAAGDFHPGRMLQRLTWVWVHCLQFCVSNQSIDTSEDKKNHPWRPISSGQISWPAARYLRWMLLVLSLSLSASWGAFTPSFTLSLATIAYNELGLSKKWFTRNALNAIGYTSFCVGATNAAHANVHRDRSAGASSLAIHVVNALIIMTTIQAQDFKDVEGDAAIGRETLPILYPDASRVVTAALIPIWSVLVTRLWTMDRVLSVSTVLVADDEWFQVWLCFLHVAPFAPL
ncbi:hypothetical protein ONZ51_g8103 [Trametes cubensis]|uniref:Uncharacterized protein n=1 Tax=Trametes cubensis TaxID=1111947 RepID=A0AAD7TP79_9APHY|nr:hypothetical protein ONZ51_g8103 [Trametes cubensis]